MKYISELHQSVEWPAIIKLDGDDELIYVADANAFLTDNFLQQTHFCKQDRLIDCSGKVYHLDNNSTLTPTNDLLNLEEVEELLKLHLSNQGTCCVSKFHANSIREALMNVFT